MTAQWEAQSNALDVRALTVRIEGRAVLDAVSLTVRQGEWLTVIGPNGAGKSTLLRALAGTVHYTGSVYLCGHRDQALARRQRARIVATVAQSPAVPAGMSVLDYVLLGRTPYIAALGRESANDLAAATAVLDQLDLNGLASRRIDTLSGGERQRVFLARALAQQTPILLLDEPTAALDIGHQQEVLELVDELRQTAGLTVIATMHDLSLAGEYADRLALLAGGSVVAHGSPEQVLTQDLLARHYGARVAVVASDHGPLVMPVRQKMRRE